MAMDDAQSQHHTKKKHPMLSLAQLAPAARERRDQSTLDGVIDGTRERWLWATMRAGSATLLDRSGYLVRFLNGRISRRRSLVNGCVNARGDTVVFTYHECQLTTAPRPETPISGA